MMGHPQHLDGSVDKGDEFIRSGMTPISEYDSEKYLKKAENRSVRMPRTILLSVGPTD